MSISTIFKYYCVIIYICNYVEAFTGLRTQVSVSDGHHFRGAWISFIVLGVIGVLYNALTISMMFSLDNRNRFPFFALNATICFSDLVFSFVRIVFSSRDWHNQSIGSSANCAAQTLLEMTCQLWIIQVFAGISWVVRSDISKGKKIKNSSQILFAIASLIYTTGVCAATIFGVGSYRVMESGTFCYLDFSIWKEVVFFSLLTVTTARIVIIYNLKVTYKIIKRAQLQLQSFGINEHAKGSYIKMVKKLNIFILVFFMNFSPVVTSFIYVWITNKHVPVVLALFCELNLCIFSGIVNPTMFFYLNQELRIVFYKTILKFLQRFGLINEIKNRVRRDSKITLPNVNLASNNVPFVRVSSIIPVIYKQVRVKVLSNGSLDTDSSHLIELDYYDYKTWLNEPELIKVFKEHGRKEYAMENFLFYEDTLKYKAMGVDLLGSVDDEIGTKEAAVQNLVSSPFWQDLEKKWIEFEKFALKLYRLYIKIPTSPLEVNIPYPMKKVIIAAFKNEDKCVDESTRLLASMASLAQENKLISTMKLYSSIFDDSLLVVVEIIKTDLFLRFTHTKSFADTMREHRQLRAAVKTV